LRGRGRYIEREGEREGGGRGEGEGERREREKGEVAELENRISSNNFYHYNNFDFIQTWNSSISYI
jgi:hypothetical protein